jgi:nitrate reductase NapAB chaperone NapD
MIIEVSRDLSFIFDIINEIYTLTIHEEGHGEIILIMNKEELEDLRDAIRQNT